MHAFMMTIWKDVLIKGRLNERETKEEEDTPSSCCRPPVKGPRPSS